jgi:hypothetical protein
MEIHQNPLFSQKYFFSHSEKSKKPVITLSIFTSMAFVKDANGISFKNRLKGHINWRKVRNFIIIWMDESITNAIDVKIESSNGLFDWLNNLFQPIKKPVRTLSIIQNFCPNVVLKIFNKCSLEIFSRYSSEIFSKRLFSQSKSPL